MKGKEGRMRGKGWEERGPKAHSKNSRSAANGGLRDGGLSKSEDI